VAAVGANTKNLKEGVLKSSLPRSPNRMRTAVRAMEDKPDSHAFSSLRSMAKRLFYNNVIGMALVQTQADGEIS